MRKESKLRTLKRLSQLMMTCVLFLPLAPAHALLMLRLDDGSDNTYEQTIMDTDGDGLVGFMGALPNWAVSVQTGLAQPTLVPGALDLISVEVSSSSPADLTIWLTDTDQTYGGIDLIAQLGGQTFGGDLSFEFWVDSGNNAYGMQQLVGQSLNNTGTFEDMIASAPALSGYYSMTIIARVIHDANQASSFSTGMRVMTTVPEPGTLGLLGAGLLGLAFVRRKKAA